MSDKSLRDLVALNLTLRFGVAEYEQLVARLGGVEALRQASTHTLEHQGGLSPRLAAEVARLLRSELPDEELAQTTQAGFEVIPFSAPAYPSLLRVIANPPLVIYVQGQMTAEDEIAIAIVGSRRATHYGLTQAARLASELAARGITIVSGLAEGIDAAAHRGALDAGGRTIAVLGGGLKQVWPTVNAGLADEISRSGALVSEFPLHTPTLRPYFPRRNRIISGLSRGVVVVEAPARSGALITADWALAQGREVLAVPGRVDSRTSRGCHRLIKEGAKLVEWADDVIAELGPLAAGLRPAPPRPKPTQEPSLTNDERKILAALTTEPTPVDDIAAACGMPSQVVASLLMVLELKKAVQQLPGKRFVRVQEQ